MLVLQVRAVAEQMSAALQALSLILDGKLAVDRWAAQAGAGRQGRAGRGTAGTGHGRAGLDAGSHSCPFAGPN